MTHLPCQRGVKKSKPSYKLGWRSSPGKVLSDLLGHEKGSFRLSQTLAKLAQQSRFDRETETSRLRRRRLPRTNTSYPVLSPAVRSDKVVPVSYCRLGVATQVLASAQPAYFDLPGIVSSRCRAYDAPPCNFVVVIEKHILAGQVLPITGLTAPTGRFNKASRPLHWHGGVLRFA